MMAATAADPAIHGEILLAGLPAADARAPVLSKNCSKKARAADSRVAYPNVPADGPGGLSWRLPS